MQANLTKIINPTPNSRLLPSIFHNYNNTVPQKEEESRFEFVALKLSLKLKKANFPGSFDTIVAECTHISKTK